MIGTITSTDAETFTCELDVVRRRRGAASAGPLPAAAPAARVCAPRQGPAYGTEQELIAIARLGLVRAVQQFDPASGTPFSAFAEELIVAELEDHIEDHYFTKPDRRARERAARRSGPVGRSPRRSGARGGSTTSRASSAATSEPSSTD